MLRFSIATLMVTAMVGCGGSNPPAEPAAATPEPPAAEAPAASPSGDGQHTMPDGTTMPGEQHGEGHEQHK